MAGDQAAGDRPVTPLGPCASTRGRALKSALSVVGFWAWDARSVGLASERASEPVFLPCSSVAFLFMRDTRYTPPDLSTGRQQYAICELPLTKHVPLLPS